MGISFQPVTNDDDLKVIVNLAQEIWTEYFTPIIGQGQVSYMLKKIQSFEAMKKQQNEGYIYHQILSTKPIGYLCTRVDELELFISKLYLLKNERGLGVGKLSLQFIESLAQSSGCKRLWLTVNKGNTDSIKTYAKWGFKVVGEPVADIGGGFVMDDYKMEKLV